MYDKILNSLKSEEAFLNEELELRKVQLNEAQKKLDAHIERTTPIMQYLYKEFGEVSDLGDRAQENADKCFKNYDKLSAGIYSSVRKNYSEQRNLIRRHQQDIKEETDRLKNERQKRINSIKETQASIDDIKENISKREIEIFQEKKKQIELNKTIAMLAEVPERYINSNDFMVKTDPSGNKHHIYFGDKSSPGTRHGHYIYNNNGSINKIREAQAVSA